MTSQEKIWKIFRGLNEFTVEEVQVLTGANANTVICFIHLLSKAGYLRKVGKRKSIKGWPQKVWKLIKNTGPKCPVQKRCLYDPNIESLMEVKDNETLNGDSLPGDTEKKAVFHVKPGSFLDRVEKATTPACGHPSLKRRGAKGG